MEREEEEGKRDGGREEGEVQREGEREEIGRERVC